MVDYVFDLELVLMVGVVLCQISELLSEMKTVLGQLRADKVFGNLDTVMQISHLNGYVCHKWHERYVNWSIPDGKLLLE